MKSINDENKQKILKKEREGIKREIHKLMKKKEEQEIEAKIEHLENVKNDSNKYNLAMRDLRRQKSTPPLLVTDADGNVAGSTEMKLKLIKQHFQEALAPEDMMNEYKSYPPCKMQTPFNQGEITKAAKSLKNGKSAGVDNLQAEFIKYAPPSIHQHIADIYNDTAETGDAPEQLTQGLLTPLPKPGKKRGPTTNLRPIILLSIIRKILTITMLNRIWDRLSGRIPKSQAAYQPGRGTTEQVLSLKLMVEKAITSSDFNIYILLLDMSKAFDTVNRKTLLEELEDILLPEEMHLISILTNRPKISIRLENQTSEAFESYQGICQGDCLSAVLFIYYLARALKDEARPVIDVYIDPKYADDITYVTTCKSLIEDLKKTTPQRLKDYNLSANETKTEEYEAPDRRPAPPPPPPPEKPPENLTLWSSLDWILPPQTKPPEPRWRECKLLGSKIGTENDIRNRKAKSWEPMKQLKDIFKSKRVSLQIKVRTFNTYVEPIFLYNSEVWTLNKNLSNQIDSFQRRLLRIALNCKYKHRNEDGSYSYRQVPSEKLYKITKAEKWTRKIKRRRLNLLGHILRLDTATPVQQALLECTKPQKNRVGKKCNTWLDQILTDLKIPSKFDTTTLTKLTELARNRKAWRSQIARSMEDKSSE